jgi:hypothetical protein
MARLDAFSAQIVKFVRSLMTDEAILELVRGKLGVSEPAPITEPAAALTSQSAAPSVAKATPKPVEPAAPAVHWSFFFHSLFLSLARSVSLYPTTFAMYHRRRSWSSFSCRSSLCRRACARC